MKIKEVYDRIGIIEAKSPILEYLPNNNNVLDLVEFWDGGPTEGHLLIQKNGESYVLYEMIHYFNSKSETVYQYTIRNVCSLQSIAQEIENFCKVRYDGTMVFDFRKIAQNNEVRHFWGF